MNLQPTNEQRVKYDDALGKTYNRILNGSAKGVASRKSLSFDNHNRVTTMSSPVQSKPTEDESPLRSSSALLAVFKKAAEADGGDILSKSAFTVLVRNLLAPTKYIPKPTDEDLAVAFTMADEDMSGGVDAFEVLNCLHPPSCYLWTFGETFWRVLPR